jgi:hypothetical protein
VPDEQPSTPMPPAVEAPPPSEPKVRDHEGEDVDEEAVKSNMDLPGMDSTNERE